MSGSTGDELQLPVVGWFTLGAVPFAFAGGLLFASAPLSPLTRLLGLFLLLTVAWRHLRPGPPRRPPLRGFVLIGGLFSFLSALLGSVGPLMAPFFLAYGLVKGAYIGTEALCTVVMHVTKLVAYGQASILTARSLAIGVAMGPLMIAGSAVGKRIVDRLPERAFVVLIEGVLVVAGAAFLVGG